MQSVHGAVLAALGLNPAGSEEALVAVDLIPGERWDVLVSFSGERSTNPGGS